jgi:hypothetical protein
LTFGLYDELKDTAPFLRAHRDEIVAAQQAAAEQAAAEAAQVSEEAHAAGAVEQRAEEAAAEPPSNEEDFVRHEEYADSPRRGEYEEEAVSAPVQVPAAPATPTAARIPAPVGPARQRAKK